MNEKKEYIERGALIEVINAKITTNYLNLYDEDTLKSTIRLAEKQPAADVEPVVRGEWIPAKDPYDRVYCYRHAGCGCEHNEQSAYCPACGAKMK